MTPILRYFLLLAVLVGDTDGYISSIKSRRRIRSKPWSPLLHSGSSAYQRYRLPSQLHVSQVKEAPLSATLEDDGKRKHPHKRTSNKAFQLKKVVRSLEHMGRTAGRNGTDAWTAIPSDELVERMRSLAYAKTQSQVSRIGRSVQEEWVETGLLFDQDVAVLDRVIRATALAGLLRIALNICEKMMEVKGQVPSSLAYCEVSVGLRRAQRLQDLEKFTEFIGRVSLSDNDKASPLDFRALNTLLAAFSDQVKATTRSNKRWDSRGENSGVSTKRSTDELLQSMKEWLLVKAPKDLNCALVSDNFATVMDSFASVGDADFVEKLWKIMTEDYGLAPTIHCYNARLKSLRDNDEQSIEVFRELLDDDGCEMDQYTIDFMLLPYLRLQPDDLKLLLRDYLDHGQSRKPGTDVFGSFLSTLCQAGEVSVANDLFETFVLSGNYGLSPTARHYNTLIAAFRRLEERNAVKRPDLVGIARLEATKLYGQMVHPDSTGWPDKYTITNMLGMAQNGVEISDLLYSAHSLDLEDSIFEPAVLRATITAFGRVGDISSAVWMLDAALRTEASDVRNTRMYNTLFAAIAHRYQEPPPEAENEEDHALANGGEPLNVKSCRAASCLLDLITTTTTASLNNAKSISMMLHNKTPGNASLALLEEMSIHGPRPNEQSFCLVAAAIQDHTTAEEAMQLYERALKNGGFAGDGRLINAILRCYGGDIMAALRAWKSTLRRNCLTSKRVRQDLTASYHGLMYVSGRALRPDLALRIVSAMNKEGLEVDEMALNCYKSGKRKSGRRGLNRRRLGFGMRQFENILEVECTTYDVNDPRWKDNPRIRIYY